MNFNYSVYSVFFFVLVLNNFVFKCVSSSNKECETQVFRLHTFNSKDTYETLKLNACLTEELKLGNSCKNDTIIKLIVHGFMEDWSITNEWNWIVEMKDELFKSSDKNHLCVIVVDWQELSRGSSALPNYFKAKSNTQIIGKLVADVLIKSKINATNVHCIGFSLGAHLCSIMCETYLQATGNKIGRLSGLDPAGSFVSGMNESEKLTRNDALFVDVIHTTSEFGVYVNSGHMDFYTNVDESKVKSIFNNRYKDMCNDVKISAKGIDEKVIIYEDPSNNQSETNENTSLSSDRSRFKRSFLDDLFKGAQSLRKRVFTDVFYFFACEHLMAVRFYIYSINYCKYQSHYCEFGKKNCVLTNDTNYPRMGYHADKSDSKYKFSNGTFYVNTSLKMPFCYDINPNMIAAVENYNSRFDRNRARSKDSGTFVILFLLIFLSFILSPYF